MGETRRRVLKFLAAAPLPACVAAGDDDDSAEPPTPRGPPPVLEEPVPVGNVSELTPGTLRQVGSERIAVGRDDVGVWALGLTCTHLACNIGDSGFVHWTGIQCACHGSRFDRDGVVTFGPAVLPLENYAVSVDGDGEVVVDPRVEVAPGTRTPVGSA